MTNSWKLTGIVGCVVLAASSACGGSPARAIRPNAPTARAALGETCGGSNGYAVFVVDWPADRRAELEGTLAQGRTGAVLVKYDCPRVQVLTGCGARVGYHYEPVSLKEEVVRLSDEDTVRAKLPLLAAGPLLPRVEAELARGSSLDLGFALVARLRSQEPVVYRPELLPQCRSATHWVSAVTLGAFAMSVGTRAQVRTTAEVFASVEASSASGRELTSRDGDLAACRSAPGANEASRLPEACRSPLQIELRPIDARTPVRAKCEDRNDESACVEWASLIGIALTVREATEAGGDPKDAPLVAPRVVDFCRHGNANACRIASDFARLGVKSIDTNEIDDLRCRQNDSSSCTMAAERLEEAGKNAEAFELFDFGCHIQRLKHDSSVACAAFAARVAAGVGPEPPEGRLQLALDGFAQACVDGWPAACPEVAKLQKRGLRPRGALENGARVTQTCETKDFACQGAAAVYALGLGVPRDMVRARKAWDRSCASMKKSGVLGCRAFPY